MSTYLRFQTSVVCPHTKHPLGVFGAAGALDEKGQIEEHFEATLTDALQWYNKNLAVPRIANKHRGCLFWFCTKHQRFVSRLWDLVAILAEHQVEVRRVRTTDPGMIVYRDEYQVAAVPSQRIERALLGRTSWVRRC